LYNFCLSRCICQCGIHNTATHPSKKRRLSAIKRGWERAKADKARPLKKTTKKTPPNPSTTNTSTAGAKRQQREADERKRKRREADERRRQKAAKRKEEELRRSRLGNPGQPLETCHCREFKPGRRPDKRCKSGYARPAPCYGIG